ncbi:Por secretion system C-terminal sorting domain-containing protein [Chryseobacterium polytrichastri]|uniref:Por secretion system C-terminal sorting domain-containing protein n=2 Tax=Chryseobacterium polytrichastri TaxID=1302687 RepID=A0A1M7ELT3_9FLAO|nr:Por secretion system C-terminal sorting domain-containing protein [Chryseobacterium polytrichastri]
MCCFFIKFMTTKLINMKAKLFFGALNIAALFSASVMMAQNFQTMPIQSGYTADVIANGIGSAAISTTTDVDGVSFAFVARDYQLTSSSAPMTYGIPANGTINSVIASTPGLSYQLADLSSNNSLKLVATSLSGTLVFATPKAATKLYMLSTSGSGSSSVEVKVNFTDNSSQTFSGVNLSDWYDGANFAIQGIGRINRTNNVLESSTTNPRLYQSLFAIDAANQAKPIQSVTVTKTAGSGVPNIFAFSADAYSDCGVPTLQAVGTLTSSTAQVSWTVPTSTQASNYEIYYSTTNTAPTTGTTPTIAGISGTSTMIDSLSPNTVYYYWVRTKCNNSTGQSVWSFSGNFKTLCGTITTMFENFDSYGTGNIVPDCWVRLAGTGSQTIASATPASGTRNLYQYTSAASTPTTVILPVFSNISAGTHKLRLKARVTTTAGGTLNVGYVTNIADTNSFVLLQALSITNTTYTDANSEYTVIVPSSVPANARLAIKSSNDAKTYYWDDVYWEAATLATAEVNGKKSLSLHPNPFREVLYISDMKEVKSITINDVSGRVVKLIDNPGKELNLSMLNSGLYLVSITFKDGSKSITKIIKQ